MGRYILTSPLSDVRYAACNFGGTGGSYYILLNNEFKPAKYIPKLTTAIMPSSISGPNANPTGYGIATNPVFTLGMPSGTHGSTSAPAYYFDYVSNHLKTRGGSTAAPGSANNMSDNYTGRHGEYGHDRWELDTDGTVALSLQSTHFGVDTKTEANDSFVNADLEDRTLTLMLYKGNLFLCKRNRVTDVIVTDMAAGYISKFTIPDIVAGYYGSASYNRTRKELVIIGGSNAASTSGMWMRLYTDVPDIKATTDINAVLSALTPVQTALTWPSWIPSSDMEAVGGCTPVLTDNGDVFITFMKVGAYLATVRHERLEGTTFKAPVNAISSTVTTTYGRHQSRGSGMQVMQARDGNGVLIYCQYAYYGSGLCSHFINKRTNTAVQMYTDSMGTDGRSVLHSGESGFIVMSNYTDAAGTGGNVKAYRYDCSTTTPTPQNLPYPTIYNTGGQYPFFIEVSV